uniref:ER membrane protein complex subunit 6 n=1 Tax=Parascaris equorum TaxID=6256 RepID=A0A914RXE4_PAREQ
MPPSSSKRSAGEKSLKEVSQVAVFSEAAIRHNIGVLEYSRTCQAAAAGMASGILGLTGIPGFVFYFVVVMIQAVYFFLIFFLSSRSTKRDSLGGSLHLFEPTANVNCMFVLQTLIWEVKAGFEWHNYFMSRTISVTHSLISGLFTYILFWVFLYGMVHVY